MKDDKVWMGDSQESPSVEDHPRLAYAVRRANTAMNRAMQAHNKTSKRRAKNRVASKSRRQNRSKK